MADENTKDGPKKGAGEDTPTGGASAPKSEPCCCELDIVCEEIKVVDLTWGGKIPVLKSLFSHFIDHVFIRSTDCAGKGASYPPDSDGFPLDEGEKAGPFRIATAKSDKSKDCYVDCVVNIVAKKEPLLNALLDKIAAIRAKLARLAVDLADVTADLTKNTDTLNGLKLAGLTGAALSAATGAAQALSAAIQNDRAKIDNLKKEIESR